MIKKLLFKFIKLVIYISLFFSSIYFFSLLSKINGKELDEEYYSEGMPTVLPLLNTELFMGLVFVVTVAIALYVLHLLWQLHEVAVHKADHMKSAHANLVFILTMCGLFIDKTWWVLALIIAFTRWDLVGKAISSIIYNGKNGNERNQVISNKSKEGNDE